jgi:hypothetical protein
MSATKTSERLRLDYRLADGVAMITVTGEIDVPSCGHLRESLVRVVSDEYSRNLPFPGRLGRQEPVPSRSAGALGPLVTGCGLQGGLLDYFGSSCVRCRGRGHFPQRGQRRE